MPYFAVIAPNRFLASTLAEAVKASAPGWDGGIYSSAKDGLAALRLGRADLVVTDPDTDDLDGLDYIPEIIGAGLALLTVIVTHRRDERALRVLRKLNYDVWIDAGVHNLCEFRAALGELLAGRRYTSPSAGEAWGRIQSCTTDRRLTPHEEMILSVLGTGMDNEEAAVLLKISSATVRTHRGRIMGKLSLQHKGRLIHYAHSRGYVRTTPEGTLHPGFERALQKLRGTPASSSEK